jgi:NitT/TauT family transport system permease protein
MCTPDLPDPGLQAAFGLKTEEPTLWDKISSTWLYKDATATFRRLFSGLMWGCVLAVLIGLMMGCYEWLAAILVPPLSFLAQIPATAMLAVFIVIVAKVLQWDSEWTYTLMIGFGVLPTLTQTVYLSARDDLHSEEINKAYTLGARNTEVIWNVVFPQILPKVIDATRLQIGPAMVYLVAAEMLLAQVGMGYEIRMQQRLMHMAVVYDYLFILGATGLLMNKSMVWFRMWMCPWYARGK